MRDFAMGNKTNGKMDEMAEGMASTPVPPKMRALVYYHFRILITSEDA